MWRRQGVFFSKHKRSLDGVLFGQYDFEHAIRVILEMLPSCIFENGTISWLGEIESRTTDRLHTALSIALLLNCYKEAQEGSFETEADFYIRLSNKINYYINGRRTIITLNTTIKFKNNYPVVFALSYNYYLLMGKANKKKPIAKSAKGQKQKKKLPRGYKQCGKCSTLLNIHKYVCDKCGHKHDMKRKKVDILKNLNNPTPKLLRSLIELNDFNDITELSQPHPYFPPSTLYKLDPSVPQQFKRRRSSKSASGSNNQSLINFTKGNHITYSNMGKNLTAVCTVQENILVAQSTEKWSEFNQSQKTTIKAYGLQQFHKLGQMYFGKTTLSLIKNKKLAYQIQVNEHLLCLRSIGNRVGALTGKGSVLVLNLNTNNVGQQVLNYEHREPLQIKVNDEDQITVMQWLKGVSSQQEAVLLVGTLMGHLYMYSVFVSQAKLARFISNAHFEALSSLAECPLTNNQQSLFASGSYDGGLAIWSTKQRVCLYRMQASNRKISGLLWDPGAKFIFVVKDENQDSGVLACFFAILKSQESVALSDQIDFRLTKCSLNCKLMYNGYNQICLLDPYSCSVKVIPTQQLRKNSLKRKKVKRQEEDRIYEINLPDLKQSAEYRMNDKILPLPTIADTCILNNQLWGITYDGLLFMLEIK